MNEQNPEQNFEPVEHSHPASETTIHVNEYGATHDQAVVIEEPDRTVLLTRDQTVVIPKEPEISIAPKNRPRRIYGGMWGPTEIATLGVSLLAVLTVVLLYLFYFIPAKNELEKNRAERDRLETELKTANSRYGSITSTQQGVSNLVSSADNFESRLPIAANGRTALYQRLNGLISAYNLTNTAGPDYAPLEVAGTRTNQSEQENGKSKFQSIFPGIYVTMTVEGSYQNLRRFIREIETSGDQFVVITSVQLEPSETKEKQQPNNETAAAVNNGAVNYPNPAMQNNPVNPGFNPIARGQVIQPGTTQPMMQNPRIPQVAPQGVPQALPPAQPAGPRGKTHGETVSLHLEMAAYFRRPGYAPPLPEAVPAP